MRTGYIAQIFAVHQLCTGNQGATVTLVTIVRQRQCPHLDIGAGVTPRDAFIMQETSLHSGSCFCDNPTTDNHLLTILDSLDIEENGKACGEGVEYR